MRKLFLLITILSFSFSHSQITTRTIEVKNGQMDKFIEMAGKKTKKFNNQEGLQGSLLMKFLLVQMLEKSGV